LQQQGSGAVPAVIDRPTEEGIARPIEGHAVDPESACEGRLELAHRQLVSGGCVSRQPELLIRYPPADEHVPGGMHRQAKRTKVQLTFPDQAALRVIPRDAVADAMAAEDVQIVL